jgi:hypothetical protein
MNDPPDGRCGRDWVGGHVPPQRAPHCVHSASKSTKIVRIYRHDAVAAPPWRRASLRNTPLFKRALAP